MVKAIYLFKMSSSDPFTMVAILRIMAAIDPCYCCTERMIVTDRGDRTLMTGHDLVRLSQEKTRAIAAKMGVSNG